MPPSPVDRPALSDQTAAAIAEQLRSAAKPVLLAGGGTRRAAAQVRRLAECAGLPVLHTLMGTGMLPPDHPQLIGMIGFWGSPAANRLASERGLDPRRRDAVSGNRQQQLGAGRHIRHPSDATHPRRLDPHEPGRNYPTQIAATADAALALHAISAAYGAADAGARLRLGVP